MRRHRAVRAIVVVAAVLAAACSSNDDATPSAGGSASTTIGGAAGTGTTAAADPGPPGGSEAGPSDTAPPGGSVAEPGPGAGPATTVAPDAPALPAPGGVGAYAPVYLRPDTGARLVLEVRSQEGAGPAASTVEHLRANLGAVTGKEVAVSGGRVGGDARSWTGADIRSEADRSSIVDSAGVPVMRLLFLRGGFADSDTTLGVAVRSDVAAVFADRVDEAAGLVGDRGGMERAITLHEAGHLLGLVDLHLATGRQDPEHPGHSPNRESVMYYAVESTLVGSILGGGPPTDFDAADRADLAAIRAGSGG